MVIGYKAISLWNIKNKFPMRKLHSTVCLPKRRTSETWSFQHYVSIFDWQDQLDWGFTDNWSLKNKRRLRDTSTQILVKIRDFQ